MELIQTIRTEIERLAKRADRRTDKDHASHNAEMERYGEDYWNGYGDLAYALLSFLSTLESEKPISQNEDFEKEIADYWTTMGWSKVMTLAKFKVIARYFYGLGLGVNDKSEKPMQEGLEEEQTCKGFEKEFHQFIKKEKEAEPDGSLPCYGDYGIYRIARHFAEWGAEHLKK